MLRLRLALGVALVAMVWGCSVPAGGDGEREFACIQDDRVHYVRPVGCKTHEDCPVGGRCLEGDEATKEGDEPTNWCKVPNERPSDRELLLSGFDVDKMSARLTGERGARVLDWTAPEGAQLTVCALFQCPPVVARSGGVDTIINFDRCVVAREDSIDAEGVFNPREPELAWDPPDIEVEDEIEDEDESESEEGSPEQEELPRCAPALVSRQPLDALLVGCWAYDNWRLTAATDLYSLDYDEVYDYGENLPHGEGGSCGPEDRGRSCVLGDGLFGTCVMPEGEDLPSCRRRCFSHSDCYDEDCSEGETYCSNGVDSPSVVLGTCSPCVGETSP